jgi:glycolate oxidase iron-sulfur subunit
LLADKMLYASATNVQVMATLNPGCLMQMRAGAEMHHTNQQVLHVIELLDQVLTK